jgi:hypothetical protein
MTTGLVSALSADRGLGYSSVDYLLAEIIGEFGSKFDGISHPVLRIVN